MKLEIDWSQVSLIGSFLAGVVALSALAIGIGGKYEAYRLLEALKPAARVLCFAAITAPGTTLALLLTVLSSSQGWKHPLQSELYGRIRHVANLSIVVIVAAVFLLVFLTIPIEKSDSLTRWYPLIYYAITTWSAVLGVLLIVTVLMLRSLILSFILAVDPHLRQSDALDGGMD